MLFWVSESHNCCFFLDRDEARSPTPEEELRRKNAMLQGRVQLLQEHNLRLENCISQLKLLATLKVYTCTVCTSMYQYVLYVPYVPV